MQTKLIYMEQMQLYECEARVIDIESKDGKVDIMLEQTIFYPQGGGQPYDTGLIFTDTSIFEVEEVRYDNGIVHHIGFFKIGKFEVRENVMCEVDKEKRKIHTRLHSIGHLIDIVVKELKLDWKSTKGYHFPQGAYSEYRGNMKGKDTTDIIRQLENKSNEVVGRNIETKIEFSTSHTQDGKPLRIIYYGDFGVPCGGTHVKNLKDISSVTIRKVKQDKDIIRVSYA